MSKKGKMSRRMFLKSAASMGVGAIALGGVRGVLSAAPKKALEKIWTMKMDHYMLENSLGGVLDDWFLDRVVEKSKGQIKIEKYWAGSLNKPGQQLSAVRNGISEIGAIAFGYTPADLPLTRGLDGYYRCPHSDTLARVCRDMYSLYKPLRDEWERRNKSKVLYFYNWSYSPLILRKPITKVEDFKGLKIRGYGLGSDTINRLGGTGVPVPIYEVYPSLERGIIDGVCFTGFYELYCMKFYEQAPYIIDIGAGAHGPSSLVMNIDLWKKLPTNLKDVFNETAQEMYDTKFVEICGRLIQEAVRKMVEAGCKFSTLPDAEIEKAKKLVQPAQTNQWIEKIAKAQGLNGQEFQAKVDELIRKYEPQGTLKTPYQTYKEHYG